MSAFRTPPLPDPKPFRPRTPSSHVHRALETLTSKLGKRNQPRGAIRKQPAQSTGGPPKNQKPQGNPPNRPPGILQRHLPSQGSRGQPVGQRPAPVPTPGLGFFGPCGAQRGGRDRAGRQRVCRALAHQGRTTPLERSERVSSRPRGSPAPDGAYLRPVSSRGKKRLPVACCMRSRTAL